MHGLQIEYNVHYIKRLILNTKLDIIIAMLLSYHIGLLLYLTYVNINAVVRNEI